MHKVLMIGLDGATFHLLDHFMSTGVMPFLKQLVDDGVRADMLSTRNPLTPPAWTSMVTGRSPDAHGVFDFLKPSTLDDGTLFLRINDARDNQCETVWSMVSRQGRRATSLNFYGMSPPPPIDGYLISGFVPWKYLRKAMYPQSLFDTVRSWDDFDYKTLGMDIGEEKKAVQGSGAQTNDGWIELQRVRDGAWTRVACHLMENDRTDLTAVVLDGPDKLQHLFWRFVDPDLTPEQPDAEWLATREACLAFYREVDDNIRRLVEAAGADTNVFLTSDHGFGPTDEVVYINEWLAREGYLVWKEDVASDQAGKLTADRMKDHLVTIDWQKTQVYCPTPSSNALYVKKDNGSGVGIKPRDYLEFCVELRRRLLEYRAPDGGQVFTRVDLNKLEGTPFVEPSPDITLHLRDGGFVSVVKADEVVVPRDFIDGTHRPNGIFIGYGPGFRRGERFDDINLLDITPLILHFLGLPVPNELEGRVPVEMLSGEQNVVRGGTTLGRQASERREPTRGERDALMKQMKILGYMD